MNKPDNEKQFDCISRIDLYQKVIEEIDNKRPPDCTNKTGYLFSIGVAPPIYYGIKAFIEHGEDSLTDRNNPLSDEKLKQILKTLEIDLVEKYYMIKF